MAVTTVHRLHVRRPTDAKSIIDDMATPSQSVQGQPPGPVYRPRRRSASWVKLGAGALAGSAGIVVLYHFRPGVGSHYPPCPIYWATGLYCPGCGITRALHHLLHGRIDVAC